METVIDNMKKLQLIVGFYAGIVKMDMSVTRKLPGYRETVVISDAQTMATRDIDIVDFLLGEAQWSLWETIFGHENIHTKFPIEGEDNRSAFINEPAYIHHFTKATKEWMSTPRDGGNIVTIIDYLFNHIKEMGAEEPKTFESAFASAAGDKGIEPVVFEAKEDISGLNELDKIEYPKGLCIFGSIIEFMDKPDLLKVVAHLNDAIVKEKEKNRILTLDNTVGSKRFS